MSKMESALSVNAAPKEDSSIKHNTKFKLVALDLDGTLLQSNHKMAEVQAEYLRSLHQQGVAICIATGRAVPSVYEHVKKLNFPEPIPVVCSNGARGLRINAQTLEREELFYDPVPKSVVESAVALGNTNGFAVQYYHEDAVYVNSSKPEHTKITSLYSRLTGSTITYVEDDFKSILAQNHLPSKLLILFDESKIHLATKEYRKEMESKATIVLGAFDWFLEILHPDVTKGHGLQSMSKQLGIPLEQCIAMGDGANDLEFLEMAGLGLAMKNAKESAKKSANSTLEWSNDEHGVMKALERLNDEGLLDVAEAAERRQ